jgi:hypothetical protein
LFESIGTSQNASENFQNHREVCFQFLDVFRFTRHAGIVMIRPN